MCRHRISRLSEPQEVVVTNPPKLLQVLNRSVDIDMTIPPILASCLPSSDLAVDNFLKIKNKQFIEIYSRNVKSTANVCFAVNI